MRSNSKKTLVKSYTNKKSNIQRSSSSEFLQPRSKSKTKKTMSKNMSKTMQSTHDSKKNLLSSFKKAKEIPSNTIKKKSSANKKKFTTKSKNIELKNSKTMIVTSYLDEEQKQNFLYEETKDQYFINQLKHNYFVYNNILIPIENSQQRKFVFKIKLIDKHSQQIAGNIKQQKKLPRQIDEATITETQHEIVAKQEQAKQKKSVSIMTMIPTLQISEIQTSVTHIQNVEIQTQATSNRSSKSINIQHLIQQKSEKCFNNTLTDLQFLYLPDNRNFQNFSNLQCKHYQDLFISLARKFEAIKKQKQSRFQCQSGEQLLQQVYSQQDIAQNVAMALCQRQCIQMGFIQTHFEQGFPTHIDTLLSYLSNLVLVAQMKEKNNIVLKMNSLYSFSYRQRFVRVYRGLPRRKNIPVLPDELFHVLERQIFNWHQFPSEDIQNAVHFNNRMFFDATNEFLQQYRPFYESGGQPFPWSQTIKASFYTIDQDNIKLLFSQVIEKLKECASMLCGIIIDYDLLLTNIQKKQPEKRIKKTQKQQKHELHLQKINIQQTKMIHYQIKRINEEPEMEEQKLILMVQLSQEVLKQIFLQEVLIFQQIFSNEQKQ